MKLHRRAAAALAAAAIVGLPIASATVFPATASAAPAVSAQDKAFLVAAHQSNLSEIAAGHAAQQKATTAMVRDHGQLFITDHTRLDGNLKALASKLGVDLPSAPNADQKAALASVSAHSGKAFDAAWIAAQITSHRASQAVGNTELANGSNADVVALDKAAAPVVASHLAMLLSGSSGGSVGAGGNGAAASSSSGTAVLPWALLVGGAGAVAAGGWGVRRRALTR